MRSILEHRFGKEAIQEIAGKNGDLPLLLIKLEQNRGSILLTNGLRAYQMPVPDKEHENAHCELYFYIPGYWDLSDLEDPSIAWVFHWIRKLGKHLTEKQTWFGHGHTLYCGKETGQLSPTMKQNHFFLVNPIDLDRELMPLQEENRRTVFLGIVPIFEDEMDYKQGKGTAKLLDKMNTKGVTEKLDDYRRTVLKSKWRLRRN